MEMTREQVELQVEMCSGADDYRGRDDAGQMILAHDQAQRDRIRTATQLIIAEIGASGPEDLEEAIGRAVAKLQQQEAALAAVETQVKVLEMTNEDMNKAFLEASEERDKWKDEAQRCLETYGDGLTLQQWAKERPQLTQRVATLEGLLKELYAMVQGECPSLLNEDSGGCARLDLAIQQALAPAPGQGGGGR